MNIADKTDIKQLLHSKRNHLQGETFEKSKKYLEDDQIIWKDVKKYFEKYLRGQATGDY